MSARRKENAAVALREIAEEPDLVVPALMEDLNDPSLRVRSITAIALCNFGERAKPAVPQIIKLIEAHHVIYSCRFIPNPPGSWSFGFGGGFASGGTGGGCNDVHIVFLGR